ncbi:hypothetical protein BPODLACK_04617 [Gordonia sp. YY1]|nr:hypothetical protein BPODLACK_04617 [Gordonia sp. YY1]
MSEVTGREALGDDHIDIATASGIVIARHRLAAPGSGAQVRDHGHVIALETLVLGPLQAVGVRIAARNESRPEKPHAPPHKHCATKSLVTPPPPMQRPR